MDPLREAIELAQKIEDILVDDMHQWLDEIYPSDFALTLEPEDDWPPFGIAP